MYCIHYINTNIKCINSTGHLSKARSWYLIKTLILTVVKLKEKEHLTTSSSRHVPLILHVYGSVVERWAAILL